MYVTYFVWIENSPDVTFINKFFIIISALFALSFNI